ncbi:MAG: prolyl oligopeptidase family serine peptidase [Prolixibacteraceae bacterium]|nr:prolyl oligopeptidase family serine peptidase [Prolixibacteraceae bacterium]
MKLLSIFILLLLFWGSANSQDPTWDDTSRPDWPEVFKDVEIPSTADGKIQKAYFYATSHEKPKPLIVSLHTWSNNYQQKDPLIREVLEKNYNCIRPNFRGPNNTPEACGSPLVTSDIDDAITYAIENGNVDMNNIHVVGVSGGGHATLLSYMQSEHDIRTFSAWVPISDLTKWYYESIGRDRKYATDIALATTGKDWKMDVEEAQRRSPLYMNTPFEKRKNSKLYIYAGIHDGYDGSVPITHSLEMYNKVVHDYNPSATKEIISRESINQMVTGRFVPGNKKEKIADRVIHFKKQFNGKIQIVIFEGGHEMLTEAALNHVPSETILAIGDSNGDNKGGWVDQLQERRFNDVFINTCVSGNTIGFDNSGKASKNTLKNITAHLTISDPDKNRLNKILIMLGTNDCKKVFNDRIKEVPGFYKQLIDSIKTYYSNAECPEIITISPPPIGDDTVLKEKYHGGAKRVRYLNKAFQKIAKKENIKYIDIQTPFWIFSDTILRDGIHFNKEGYRFTGLLINKYIEP